MIAPPLVQSSIQLPPFRADHVGSLLRPAAVRRGFKQHEAGAIDDEAFRRIQDAAIRDAVRMQEEVGLEVVTDGEFRRGSYWERFVARLDGIAVRTAAFKFRDDRGNEVEFTAPHATGKISRSRPIALDEFAFLQEATTATPKITLPAPSTMHFYCGREFADPRVYPDVRAFFADLGEVYRQEIAELAKAGCRYVQLDEVAIAMLCDPAIREKVAARGSDPDALVDLYIEAINQAIARRPVAMALGIHMCRGNFRGRYLAEGGYESVAERFFGRADATHFLLEYDTPRAGDFKPLRFVPKRKGVVLGLISTKTPVLESLDALALRIAEAANFIDLDRLAISPQCGFASTAAGNPLTEADERAKLSRVVEAARMIWN